MSAPRSRIPLNPEQRGLNQAFAGFELAGIPPGPELAEADSLPEPTPAPGRVVLRKETAQRGGKTVLVVDQFGAHFSSEQLQALASRLRAACGCGGTVKGRAIELQGSQPEKVRTFLQNEGFSVAGCTS